MAARRNESQTIKDNMGEKRGVEDDDDDVSALHGNVECL